MLIEWKSKNISVTPAVQFTYNEYVRLHIRAGSAIERERERANGRKSFEEITNLVCVCVDVNVFDYNGKDGRDDFLSKHTISTPQRIMQIQRKIKFQVICSICF